MSNNQCAFHLEPITHYCQSCKDLVCLSCVTKQPHSGSNHVVKQIQVASKECRTIYEEYVSNEVNTIRAQCHRKLVEIQRVKKQVERDKNVIQKDVRIEFQGIGNRLEDQQKVVIINKQTEIKHLQNYVHTIDDTCAAFDLIFDNPQAVLLTYKSLDHELKKLEALRTNLDQQQRLQHKGELGRQFPETLNKVKLLPQYEQRNKFLNEVIEGCIYTLQDKVSEKQRQNKQSVKRGEHTYNNIFQKVVGDQSAKYCVFCGFPFTVDNANDNCTNNKKFKMEIASKEANWEQIIPEEARGTKRHFWFKSGSSLRKRPSLQSHSMVRKAEKKHFWNALQQLETVKHIIKRHQIENGQSFERVAEDNDPNETGLISNIAFVYIMSKTYKIEKVLIDSLITLFSQNQQVNYPKLLNALSNPTADYSKFVDAQLQAEKSKPIAPATSYYKRY